jgi:cytosine/adenosine deaminase-related metal-dependent hydrolase
VRAGPDAGVLPRDTIQRERRASRRVEVMSQIVRGRFVVERWGPPPLVHEGAAVHVEDGHVRAVEAYDVLRRRCPGADVLGDGTHLVMPGLVNAHSHGRGITTLRLGIPDEPGEIRSVALRRGLAVDPHADVLLGCVRQLEAGITATMHLDSNFGGPPERYEERLTAVVRAYRESGIRFGLGVGIRDQNTYGPYIGDAAFFARLPSGAQAEVAEWPSPVMPVGRYLELCARLEEAFPGLELQYAPLNPDTCTDDLLRALRQAATARGKRINIHLLETAYQKAHALERWGETAVSWLARTGFLGPDVVCAHCVWLTGDDVARMRETGAVVAHNPGSNLRLRSGLAPVRPLLDAGVAIALGTDNLGVNDEEDLLQEARLAQLLHSPPGLEVPPIPAATVLAWATECGAAVLGPPRLGRVEPGAPADLVLARLAPVARALDGPGSVAAAVVQWLRPSAVDVVMVAGRVAVREGRYVLGDRDEIERRAYGTARRWSPAPAVTLLRDAVTDLYRAWPGVGEPYYRLQSRR